MVYMAPVLGWVWCTKMGVLSPWQCHAAQLCYVMHQSTFASIFLLLLALFLWASLPWEIHSVEMFHSTMLCSYSLFSRQGSIGQGIGPGRLQLLFYIDIYFKEKRLEATRLQNTRLLMHLLSHQHNYILYSSLSISSSLYLFSSSP